MKSWGLSPGLSDSKSCVLIGDLSPGAQKDFGYFSRIILFLFLSFDFTWDYVLKNMLAKYQII